VVRSQSITPGGYNQTYTPTTSCSVLANSGFNLHRPTRHSRSSVPSVMYLMRVALDVQSSNRTVYQGLPLVHFSAQPEPFLSLLRVQKWAPAPHYNGHLTPFNGNQVPLYWTPDPPVLGN